MAKKPGQVHWRQMPPWTHDGLMMSSPCLLAGIKNLPWLGSLPGQLTIFLDIFILLVGQTLIRTSSDTHWYSPNSRPPDSLHLWLSKCQLSCPLGAPSRRGLEAHWNLPWILYVPLGTVLAAGCDFSSLVRGPLAPTTNSVPFIFTV